MVQPVLAADPLPERRRCRRVARVLPLTIHLGGRTLPVRTVDISADGALLAAPECLRPQSGGVLENPSSGKRVPVWVVRCLSGELPGTYEAAVAFIEPSPVFWGGTTVA